MENPFNVEKPVRSPFLTVLCILTFIGSGWGLINNLFQLAMFTPERLVAQIQQITTMAGVEAQPSWVSSMLSSSLEVLQTTIMHGKAIYSLAALCAVIVSMAMSGFFALLFIILYGLNYSKLKY